jgi:hypothetical protein
MPGLRGQARVPEQVDPRLRRNAAGLATDSEFLFSGALTVVNGVVTLNLSSVPGLDQVAGLQVHPKPGGGVAVDASGVYVDSTIFLTVSAASATYLALAGGTMAGNIALGANTLTTSNTTVVANFNADLWDGQQFADWIDQAVKTTSSPTFASLGVGTAPQANVGMVILGGSSNVLTLAQGADGISGTNGFRIYGHTYWGSFLSMGLDMYGHAYINLSSSSGKYLSFSNGDGDITFDCGGVGHRVVFQTGGNGDAVVGDQSGNGKTPAFYLYGYPAGTALHYLKAVMVSGAAQITTDTGAIDFDNEALSTTGTMQAGGYKASDGTAGATADVTISGTTLHFKNGLFTGT